ncbi:MAG: RAMP superfamily CRISPR-associated protein [Candidatus Methanomethylicia archaeon]
MIDYRLNSRYIINMRINPISPIHIGAGEEGFVKGIVSMKISGITLPIIPAESIKGILRSMATRIANSIRFNKVMYDFNIDEIVKSHDKDVHTGYLEKTLKESSGEELRRRIWKTLSSIGLSDKQISKFIDEVGSREALELSLSLLCPICLLFGSRHYAGKILITDAIPVDQNGEIAKPEIETRTCVSISRRYRVAEPEKLYTIQYITPRNISFKSKMIIDNVMKGDTEAKLLAYLLKHISENEVVIGGLKSRGFGFVKIDSEIMKMKLTKPKNISDLGTIMSNIKALLMREDAVEKLTISQMIIDLTN